MTDDAGYPIEVDEKNDEPDIEEGMSFYLRLDRELAGDRDPETGFPSRMVVDYVLDDWGVQSRLNREVARHMLGELAGGRNEGRAEPIEAEKRT